MEYVKYESVTPDYELQVPTFKTYLPKNIPILDYTDVNSPNYNIGTGNNLYDNLLNTLGTPQDTVLNVPQNTTQNTPSDITSIGNFNIKAAIDELHNNVNYQLKSGLGRITSDNVSLFRKKDPHKSGHKCGVSVRLALLAGGLNISNGGSGGSYGRYLELAGWQKLPVNSAPQKGDIAVTTPYGKHTNGHVSMFDGQRWVSDFILRDILVYGLSSAAHTNIYRYNG